MPRSIGTIVKGYLPILEWLPNYPRKYLPGDLSAGLTVGIMLIPQGMAYAMLAGLPAIHGLYAVTLPLLLFAIFGTSRQLAIGPAAMVSLLTAAGIATLELSSPEEYLIYALTLAFLVGIVQFGLGFLRLGFVVNFISNPVIVGFTSAAAIIIGFSQLKHLLRINLPNSVYVQEMILALSQNIQDTHWPTLLIGVMAMFIIKYGKKIHKRFPAALAAVVFGIGITAIFGLDEKGVNVLGAVPAGLPDLSLPVIDGGKWLKLMPIALTIAFVGFAESFAVAKTIHAKHKDYRLDPNQELMGLGMANMGASLVQAFPVTGGLSRSAVNDAAGAKTAMSSIFSALLIVLTLIFFTGLFYYLPNAVLAAVVLVAVSSLINLDAAKTLWHKDKSDFFMLLATFLVTLTMGIQMGILSGMVLSLLVVIYRASRPHMAELGRVPGTQIFRNVARFDNLEVREDLLIVRIDGPIYFANVSFIKDRMDNLLHEKQGKTRTIVFNMESVTHIDSTGAHAFNEWIEEWRKQEIDVCMSSIKGPVRDVLGQWGFLERMGAQHIFLDDITALSAFDHGFDESELEKFYPYASQRNEKK